MVKSEKILGFSIENWQLKELIEEVPKYFKMNKKMLLTSLNPQILLMALKDEQVGKYLHQSTHRFPDGIGVVKVSKWTSGNIQERVAGIEVMMELIRFAEKNSKSIFLYGASPNVVEKAVLNLKRQHPELKVAGYIDGYTTKSDKEIIRNINDSQADIIFVALGSPKQEKWLLKYYSQLDSTVFQNVGGSFDVISGEVNRAPAWIIEHNLEWLYRSLSNPKRIYRILQLPVFVVKSLYWNYRYGNE